jgi:hypothetical protein
MTMQKYLRESKYRPDFLTWIIEESDHETKALIKAHNTVYTSISFMDSHYYFTDTDMTGDIDEPFSAHYLRDVPTYVTGGRFFP